MVPFESVRERIPAEEAAQFYGLTFDSRGWAVCPFHGDRHPSMSFRRGRFRCWTCGVSGDSIDLVSRLFDLDSVAAVHKLDQDFSLGLVRSGSRMTREEARKREQLIEAHKVFENWREQEMRKLNQICYKAHTALQAGPPWAVEQSLAIRNQDLAEYCSDILDGGIPDEQAQLFRERRRMSKWTEQILKGC